MDAAVVRVAFRARSRRLGAAIGLALVIAALVVAAPGCGNDPPELRSNEWNQMEWDEGAWGSRATAAIVRAA